MTAKSTWRAIHASLWGDAWFRELPTSKPSAQLLWLYLRTGPHNTSLEWLFRMSEAVLADELGWSLEELRQCWRELERVGKVRADWKARVVWLPDEMGERDPVNSDVIIGWESLVPAIPQCPLKEEACKAIAAHCLKRAPAKSLPTWQSAVRRVFGDDTVSDTVRDTVADTYTCTSTNTQTSTPPPTPSGGESPKAGGGVSQEEKDRNAKAQTIVDAYIIETETQHCSSASAVPIVAKLLADGITEATLRLATKTYAADAKRMVRVERRFGPTTFFKGEWRKYKDGPPAAKVDTSRLWVKQPLPVRTPEEIATARANIARRKALENALKNGMVPPVPVVPGETGVAS